MISGLLARLLTLDELIEHFSACGARKSAHRRQTGEGEDDGWLLSLVYDGAEHRSRLYVLDARDVEAEQLAIVHLPHHVPYGFHGTFSERVAV